MTSQGGGKARDKLSHRNKPYERRRVQFLGGEPAFSSILSPPQEPEALEELILGIQAMV